MAPHLQKFCGQIVKHSLLPAKELETVYRDWRANRPFERDNLRDFIRYLLDHSAVTQAQVDRLVSSTVQEPPTPPSIIAPAENVDVVLVAEPTNSRSTRRDAIVAGIAALITSLIWLVGLSIWRQVRAHE